MIECLTMRDVLRCLRERSSASEDVMIEVHESEFQVIANAIEIAYETEMRALKDAFNKLMLEERNSYNKRLLALNNCINSFVSASTSLSEENAFLKTALAPIVNAPSSDYCMCDCCPCAKASDDGFQECVPDGDSGKCEWRLMCDAVVKSKEIIHMKGLK